MIYLGNNKIGSIYSGENKIDKIYKGEELVYSSSPYVLATDADFSGTVNGRFVYVGSDDYVIIPKVIKGVTITATGYGTRDQYGWVTGSGMFKDSTVKGVMLEKGNSVISMINMFYYCKSTTLDLSNLDTSNVTNILGMFRGCSATELDVSNFDTSKITAMDGVFRDCKLNFFDLSSWDTSKVTRSSYIFSGVSNKEGYARTQADANFFNRAQYNPVRFTVKPT